MAFEPTVKQKSVKSPSYSDTHRRGTSTSRHSLNVFKNLEQDNYISRHRGLTPSPSASGALGTFDLKMPSTVSESLPRASIDTSRTHGIDATRQSPGTPHPLGESAPRPFFGQNTAHPGL